jgi:nucleoid-associated protein YgaU
MLEDFRQDKQDQQQSALDPLAEGSSLPLSKKVILLCLAVALIGLCIFFTSDSWGGSDSKHEHRSKSKESISAEIEQIKARLTELEQKTQPHVAPAVVTPLVDVSTVMPEEQTPAINLQSLIEQELQESHTVALSKDSEPTVAENAVPTTPKKKAVTATKSQTYTVKKGDSLSKISLKVYGTTKQWKKIVDANKDKLGHSQVLRPGMILTIPTEEN